MNAIFSFPPLISDDAKILILGSIPGIRSLQQQQYYAHPRNAFWPIMAQLFLFDVNASYQHRCQELVANRVAVWDVLKGCEREGSLDSAIVRKTEVPNNFPALLRRYPTVSQIFFNGGKAEALFKRHMMKRLRDYHLAYQRLPSTSPAYAAKSQQQKLQEWRELLLN